MENPKKYTLKEFQDDVGEGLRKLGNLGVVLILTLLVSFLGFFFGLYKYISQFDPEKVKCINVEHDYASAKDYMSKIEAIIKDKDQQIIQADKLLSKLKSDNSALRSYVEDLKAATARTNSKKYEIINLSGVWGSNIGVEYRFNQDGKLFYWDVIGGQIKTEKGTGHFVNSNDIVASWFGTSGGNSGTAKVLIEPSGMVKIVWAHGVVMWRK